MLRHRHFLVMFITARSLKNAGKLSKILDHRHSLTEAATERYYLKKVVCSITHKFYYLIWIIIWLI